MPVTKRINNIGHKNPLLCKVCNKFIDDLQCIRRREKAVRQIRDKTGKIVKQNSVKLI